ncbi:hypothetical protein K1T35_17030 [Pseudonocardia sp. DSM 110487]|nr:hypothetical protein [Pseudonocardia sp. DSM 110487]QYN38754.1 hypothetical protein K1T35_17030 [Pseudonocardia sp. DSM 110487]
MRGRAVPEQEDVVLVQGVGELQLVAVLGLGVRGDPARGAPDPQCRRG